MNHIFDSTEESYTIRHLTDRVRSVNVERTFCPLNIRYIRGLSQKVVDFCYNMRLCFRNSMKFV